MSVFRAIRRVFLAALGSVMLLSISIAGVLAYPEPFYAYRADFGRLSLHSDRAFDPDKAHAILADVERRLAAAPSDLSDPDSRYRIFVSNAEWRRRLTFLWAYGAGGVNFYPIAGSVFLRQSDIDNGRVLRSDGSPVPPPRTLAYYAAHEIGHSLIGQRIGAVANWRVPAWKREGLADYVGFGGDVDIDAMAAQLLAGRHEFDPVLGFYARYRLLVAYLIEREGWSIDRLLASDIGQAEVEDRLLSSLRAKCPASEVRDTLQHSQTRTSEAKGHWQVYDSSAAFRFEVPERDCCTWCRNFKSAALALTAPGRRSRRT